MDRFWSKVRTTGFCWEWIPSDETRWYGRFFLGGRLQLAHRVAYELLVGPIPEGLVIDHLCRNPACVNPDHLEPVTLAENTRRGQAGAHQRVKTQCPHGHPYDDRNTLHTASGRRVCRTCKRARAKRV